MNPAWQRRLAAGAGKDGNVMREKVFICSPFRGDMERNAKKAAAYSRMACEQGYLPIAPHLLFPQFLNEGIEEERQIGISMGLELLLCCDEVWVFGEATEGMRAEIAYAVGQGKKIRFMEGGSADADSDGADTGYGM